MAGQPIGGYVENTMSCIISQGISKHGICIMKQDTQVPGCLQVSCSDW